jgi:hypothetical protein
MATKAQKKSRTFVGVLKDKTQVKVTVREPSQKESVLATRQFRSAFTQALMDGQPTRSVLLKRLEDNGLWSKSDKAEFTQLRSDYMSLLEQTQVFQKPGAELTDDQKTVVKRRDEAFAALNAKRADVETMLQYTADALAEDAQALFLTACVTEYVDGRRVFESVEALQNSEHPELAERAKYEFMTFSNGVDSQWDELTKEPEVEDKGDGEQGQEPDSKPAAAPADTEVVAPPAATDPATQESQAAA